MKRIQDLVILSTMSAVLSTGFAFAQDRDDHRDQDRHDAYSQEEHHDNDRRDNDRRDADRHDEHFVRHDDWKKGYHMRHEDWERARHVDDWRAYHLSAPPRGYEWRYEDGYYVLAAIDTGIIASVVAANAAHY